MLRPFLAAIGLMAALVSFPSTSEAFLWGLFGGSDKWKTMDPAEQDALAAPEIEKAHAADLAGKPKTALKYYNRVWKRYPGSQYAAEALFRSGRIELERHRWRQSFRAYTTLTRLYPESPYFNVIVADLFDIATAYEEGNHVYWLWVVPYRAEGRALAAYEAVIRTAPFSDYAPIALMRVAMIYKREGNTVMAVDALDRLINFYPTTMLSGEAHLLLAETFADEVKGPEYDQGATREAISYYRDFLLLYPDNPMVGTGEQGLQSMRDVHARSKLVMGEFFYHYRDDYAAAEVFFNEAITIAPDSSAAHEARDYLVSVTEIKTAYPEGDWPRRRDWEYLLWWREWPPAPSAARRSEVDDGADRPIIPGVDQPLLTPVGQDAANPSQTPSPAR